MKLLVENKKKLYIYIGVIALCLGLMWWIWFGGGLGGSAPAPSVTTLPTPTQSSMLAGGSSASSTASRISGAQGKNLPYGSELNMKILNDERFKSLISGSFLGVFPAQLGRVNPFGPVSAQEQLEAAAGQASGESYNNQNWKFSFNYPSGWQVSAGSGLVAYKNPDSDKSGEAAYGANIAVSAEPDAKKTINEVAQDLKKELSSTLNNYSLISEKAGALDGGEESYLLEYTAVSDKIKLHIESLIVMVDGKRFLLTASSLDSAWAKNKETLENSIFSFKTF